MQDKLFKVLLILSAIVIPVIGGGIIYSLTVDASGAFEVDSGTLSSLTTG